MSGVVSHDLSKSYSLQKSKEQNFKLYTKVGTMVSQKIIMSRAEASEDVRRAAVRKLVSEMEASFTSAQAQARTLMKGAPATNEEELELLAGEAIRTARHNARRSSKRKVSRQRAENLLRQKAGR